jgi:hypothetical protein
MNQAGYGILKVLALIYSEVDRLVVKSQAMGVDISEVDYYVDLHEML